MTAEELYQQFLSRYDSIIHGGIDADMQRLGNMTKRVMRWLIAYEPALAAQAIAILDSENTEKQYRNYLSEQEARAIVEQMDPKPKGELDELEETLESMNLPTEEPPYFNRWALLTTMKMIQSDEGWELKNILKASSSDERLLVAIYKLAKARLTDKDGRFNIRRYFELN